MIHQLTITEANVSATPHQKGMKNAPQLNRANRSQKDFFWESKGFQRPSIVPDGF